MNDKLNFENDNLLDDFLFQIPNYIALDDTDEFSASEPVIDSTSIIDDTGIESIDDDEFHAILKELGTLDINPVTVNEDDKHELSLEEQKRMFAIEKELAYAKLNLERDELEFDKEKFKKEKESWEKMRKLSEESFQAEKEEFTKQMNLKKEKMYLETKELLRRYADEMKFTNF